VIAIDLPTARLEYYPAEGRHRTVFPCGCAVDAVWTYEPPDFDHAAEAGYERTRDGVTAMHVQHDLLHSWLSDVLEHRASQTLWFAAHRRVMGWYKEWAAEEARVFAMAFYLNTGLMRPALRPLVDRLPELAHEARELLARLDEGAVLDDAA
jgi:hypothetical protein